MGIAGLGAGVDFILKEGIGRIRSHEKELTSYMLRALRDIPGLIVYGPLDAQRQTATLSVKFDSILPIERDDNLRGCGSINLEWMDEGISQEEAGAILNSEHDILVRVGLHCAPLAHKTLGTFPEGTVRLSMGYFNTLDQVEFVAGVLKQIAER